MLIEDGCRECVDNNYLKDACHLTTIILHLSSKQVQENVFKVQDREVALQHKQNAENATIAQVGFQRER